MVIGSIYAAPVMFLNGNSGYFELFINGSKESGVQKNENPNFGSTAYIGRVFTGPNSSNAPRFLPGMLMTFRVIIVL